MNMQCFRKQHSIVDPLFALSSPQGLWKSELTLCEGAKIRLLGRLDSRKKNDFLFNP